MVAYLVDLWQRGSRLLDGESCEPLYVDSCCHVGARGNTIVADAMFKTIRRDLEQKN